MLPIHTLCDKFNIILQVLLLWGMAVTGETLRLWGGFSRKAFHHSILVYPCSTFSNVSPRSCVAASGPPADGCDPFSIAALSISIVHGSPQSDVQPSMANFHSNLATGCLRASPDHGAICPPKKNWCLHCCSDNELPLYWLSRIMSQTLAGLFILTDVGWRLAHFAGGAITSPTTGHAGCSLFSVGKTALPLCLPVAGCFLGEFVK